METNVMASQPGPMEQWRDHQKWPNSYRAPTHAEWAAEIERLRELCDLRAREIEQVREKHGNALIDRDRLRAALNSVVKHWREFGPEHGFDETLERAALAGGAEAKPSHAEHLDAESNRNAQWRALVDGAAVPANQSRDDNA